MTISRRLAEAMGGGIRLESEPGRGSTFTFSAPFQLPPIPGERRMDSGLAPGAIVASAPTGAAAPVVMLVEDNPVNRKLATALLKKRDCLVLEAEDGIQAVELFLREKVDLILMDIEMPGMNGLDTTLAIRTLEEPAGRHTPIIAMTAHAMKGDRERFLGAGMDDYISKPIDPRLLFDAVARHSGT